MFTELRAHPRFEPAYVDATLEVNGAEITGRVLDLSRGGMAVALPEKIEPLAHGTPVKVWAEYNDARRALSDSIVLRNWSGEGIFNIGKGVSLKFNNEISDNDLQNDLLKGVKQKTRLAAQGILAESDIDYLHDYRRDLINCQIRLFILTVTAGVALAGAYFGLTYHSIASNKIGDADLAFWRTLIAALPGFLSMACAMMVAQKAISIQRLDSFLMVINECKLLNQFPREYKGWEAGIRRMRHALGSYSCKSCRGGRMCGRLTKEDEKAIADRGLVRNPRIDLYHLILNAPFFVIFALSVTAFYIEVARFNWHILNLVILTVSITIAIAGTIYYLFRIYEGLRTGNYCIEKFRRCWIDILNRCRWPAPC